MIKLSPTKLYYLASPYTKYPGGIQMAFEHVCKVAGWLTLQGIGVYSPIAHTHPISMESGIDPYAHDIWLPQDFKIMSRCDDLLIAKMKTWELSYGIGQEISFFMTNHGKKPLYLEAGVVHDILNGGVDGSV